MNQPPTARILHRLLALLAVACALVATAATPAAAQSSPMYRFVPHFLLCNDFEDYWPDWRDEIYFLYSANGAEAEHYADMTTGDTTIPAALVFAGNQLRTEVREWDRGKKYSLGVQTLNTNILYQQLEAHFTGNGWNYVLVYHMEPVGSGQS